MEPIEYGFADNKGVKIEYGIYGKTDGEPVMLLPPNGGSMHSFDDSLLEELAQYFKVITVSPRSWGNSSRGEGKVTFEKMSDDLAVLLDMLQIDKTRIFGFSDGGNLGMVFAVAHQDRVRALAVMGSNLNTRGTKTSDQIGIHLEQRKLQWKARRTKDPAVLHRCDVNGMMVGQPHLTYKKLSVLKVPFLNIFGEFDMIKRRHSRKISKAVENSEELMVLNCGHSTCFRKKDQIIMPVLLKFFIDN